MEYINSESFEEIKHHGNKMFPLSIYPVPIDTKGPIMQYHWHRELEFIYLAKGEAVFTINDDDFSLQAGDCLFINSGKIHSGFSNSNTCKYISIVFDTSLITSTFDVSNELFNKITTGKYNISEHFSPDNPKHTEIINELKNIISEFDNKAFAYELIIKSRLLSIFTIILRNSLYNMGSKNRNDLNQSKKYEVFKKILSFIENNSNTQIKLSDLSDYVNLTPQYICTFFKDMTNMSIIQYINNSRIEKAISMLKVSTLPITDIALECGFDNISYFNRVFKKQVHCTPKEFRQRNF